MSLRAVILASALCLLSGGRVHAARAQDPPLVFAVVVGNNDGLGMLPQLRFADDDALRFYRLAVRLAGDQNVALLTELDVDTWRRIQLAGQRPPPFLPPTKRKLEEVIGLFKQQIARLRREQPNRHVHFYFFFSGHGERGYFFLKRDGGQLADAVFTGADLQRVFADSAATLNGLFIDACKSQSLFQLKGRTPEDDELGPDFSSLIARLDRNARDLPIGVLTSTVADKPAGEGRDIQGGYFSHVLTSGLSGAADANSDGVVQYGELAAFVSFHTRRVGGQRPWFRPPRGRMDETLTVLRGRRDLLQIPPGIGGHFVVFDSKGHNLLLELHKSDAQWTRLILAPGRYKVVWVRSDRALSAAVDLHGAPVLLTRAGFNSPATLGADRMPKGEGLGAPPPEPEEAEDVALRAFDTDASGFDQAFTPRVVSTLRDAYSAAAAAEPAPEPLVARRERPHLLWVGYGYAAPPVSPFAYGHALSVGYSYRLGRLLRLGGRGLVALSDHADLAPGRSFRMTRFALQADALLARTFGRRIELAVGGYLGWQLAVVSSNPWSADPTGSTYGDPAGMRAGLLGSARVAITSRLGAALEGSCGVELVHQRVGNATSTQYFLRPGAVLQVSYAF
jgi:hypothetical protein